MLLKLKNEGSAVLREFPSELRSTTDPENSAGSNEFVLLDGSETVTLPIFLLGEEVEETVEKIRKE